MVLSNLFGRPVRPRRDRRAASRAARPRCEGLEGRALLTTSGQLDLSFGLGGKVVTGLRGAGDDHADAVALQADGKVVVAGWSTNDQTGVSDFALTRVNPNGSPDLTFGENGRVTTDLFPGSFTDSSQAAAVAVQADGKIVAAGTAFGPNGSEIALVRYNPNGGLDTTFGNGGVVLTQVTPGNSDAADGLAIQPDGKIVVAGSDNSFGATGSDFAVLRYTTRGALDTTFNHTGVVVTDFQGRNDAADAVSLTGDGRVVVAGVSTDPSSGTGDVAVARYLANGSPDTSFSGNGQARTNLTIGGAPSNDAAYSLAVQPDGGVVVAATALDSAGANPQYDLIRYRTTGALDASGFGAGGVVSIPDLAATENPPGVPRVALRSDGRIMFAATTFALSSATAEDFFVARYNANGTPDTKFGSGGRTTGDFGGTSDFAAALVLDGAGRAVVTGTTFTAGAGPNFAVARFLPNGGLDNGFGKRDRVSTDFTGQSEDLAAGVVVQNDGRVVVAGTSTDTTTGSNDFALTRYNTDGSLDASFGNGGEALTDVAEAMASGVALQRDGKIVVAGTSFGADGVSLALARYTTNGGLDPTFGAGGEALIPWGGDVTAVALQADGKIVVAGTVFSTTTFQNEFELARVNPDGTLDTTFGAGGIVTTDIADNGDFAQGVAVGPDGKIVAAGSSTQPDGTTDFAVVRYTTAGALDPTFGAGGVVLTPFAGGFASASAVSVTQGGYVLAVGSSGLFGARDFALARYRPDGSLDPTFGTAGQATTDFHGGDDAATSVAVLSNGGFVVAGQTTPEDADGSPTGPSVFALAAYTPWGRLNSTFGAGGLVTTDFTGDGAMATGVAIERDGDIIVAGWANSGLDAADFAVARYEGVIVSVPSDPDGLLALLVAMPDDND